LCSNSDLQRQIDNGLLADDQIDPAPQLLLEPGHVCGELILAHWKQRHIVAAALARQNLTREPGVDVLNGNTHSGHPRSRRVPHDTQDRCGGSLSKNQAGSERDQCNNRYDESSKHTHTAACPPYHDPLLSNAICRSENQYGRRLGLRSGSSWSVLCYIKRVALTAAAGNQRSLELCKILVISYSRL